MMFPNEPDSRIAPLSRDFIDLIARASRYVPWALNHVCMQVQPEPAEADLRGIEG